MVLFEGTSWEVRGEDHLIIGLDFGTTFSGIAYAFSNSKEPISILDWPGLEGHKQPKVPTIISYDPSNRDSFTWGAQRHKHTKIEGIKLLLDPDQETPIYLPQTNTAQELRKLNQPVVGVVGDYLASIYSYALGKIKSKVPADYFHMCQKIYVVSVPAVWSDKAKNITLRAAKRAGIHPIHLIKEPEAAALYTLNVLAEKALAIGDAFVVCDAGGGTVDLISYEISSVSPRLELKELVPGKGGMAGSLGLNKRFEQAVKDVVGEDQFYHLRKTKGFDEAMSQFDRSIKTAFQGDLDEDYYVNFPMAQLQDDPLNNIQDSCWNLKGDTLRQIFQPLITDIQRLVGDQVNLVRVKRMMGGHPKAEKIKAIFLVGGFGSNEYLKQCLEDLHPDIQIIQPHDAWSAIVKGAVLSQMPNEAAIISTQATKHYGVSALDLCKEEDAGQPKERDKYTGQDRVEKMTWYIRQGEDLKRDHRMVFPFYRTLEEGFVDHSLIFRDELLHCDISVAPKWPTVGVTKRNCSLTADLRSADRRLFKKVPKWDGTGYGYQVHYNLVVTTKAANMKFSLEVAGKEIGSVAAAYE